jgi:RimJ/RimL family protein N-acetyltransferase
MDDRIREWIENTAGLPITEIPEEGVHIRVSRARTDEPKNRLLTQRITEKNGVLITGIPRIVEAIKNYVETMNGWEIFSPFGLAEIKRTLSPDDAKHFDEFYGLDYFLTEREQFRPVKPRYKVIPLKKKDIPPGDETLRFSERRSTEKDDFTWAFACYHNDPKVPATVLPEYGPQCACVAVVFWKNEQIAGFGVATEEGLRGKSYATDVVSTATQFVLDQGGVAWYGAYANNAPSIHIPRRLGYSLVCLSFSA